MRLAGLGRMAGLGLGGVLGPREADKRCGQGKGNQPGIFLHETDAACAVWIAWQAAGF